MLALAAKHLLDRGRLDLAREVAAAALAEDDACANAHSVMHVVCDELGDWVAGLGHARRAAELLPGSAQLRYNLALSALRLDDYRTGFALMEARLDKPDWTGLAIAPSRAAERDRLLRPGTPVDGRHILVVVEQGLGDCIMFARYLPMLAARGARIALVCSPPLRPVFERVAGIDALLSPPADQPFAKINLSQAQFDFWVPLLSLPHYFGTEFGTVPADIPYLAVNPAGVAAWRERYRAKGRPDAAKFGLVYHANPVSASAIDRSIPLADLAPLLRLPGIDWVNLQGGPPGREFAAAYPEPSTRRGRKSRSTNSPPRSPPPTGSSASTRWPPIAPARSATRCFCWSRSPLIGDGASPATAPPGTPPASTARRCDGTGATSSRNWQRRFQLRPGPIGFGDRATVGLGSLSGVFPSRQRQGVDGGLCARYFCPPSRPAHRLGRQHCPQP